MYISLFYTNDFESSERIVAVHVASRSELILVEDSGAVYRYNILNNQKTKLFSTHSSFTHADGGFDLNDRICIYTMDNIVVVVNDLKCHGFIHFPEHYQRLDLNRKNYYAEVSGYPIALYKDKKDKPHIIYSVAWNQLQIMNLETRQVLTADKSLIKENAEEDHIKFYKNYPEGNKLPWPHEYDYFYGELHLSPNSERFLSAGWAWGSSDSYNIYDINHFISNNRIRENNIDYWEHNGRGVCWINDQTVAVTFSPIEDDDETASKDSPGEIHIYKIGKFNCEIFTKIQLPNVTTHNAELFYSNQLDRLILTSSKIGVLITELNGHICFHDKELIVDQYSQYLNLFLKKEDQKISLHTIKE